MVSGKYLSCIKRHICGPSKIFALNFSVLSAGSFSHKHAKQSRTLFKAFTNCFHTLIWRGGNDTLFGLINKGQCIIFLSPISNPSLFGQLSLVECSWQALRFTDTRNMEILCIHYVAQPTCTKSCNLLQIIQSCSSTMLPGTEYSDIGFYCSYRCCGNFGTRKAEVLNSLIINTTAKANDTTDILQTFRQQLLSSSVHSNVGTLSPKHNFKETLTRPPTLNNIYETINSEQDKTKNL